MLRFHSVCVCGVLLMTASGLAAPVTEPAQNTKQLAVTGHALAITPLAPNTAVQLSPRQATLRVRGPGHPDYTYQLQHSTHRPVQYSLSISNSGNFVQNHEAVVSRDGGHTWHSLPLATYRSDQAVLPWSISIRGYEQVIVEVREKKSSAVQPEPKPTANVTPPGNSQLNEIQNSVDCILGLVNELKNQNQKPAAPQGNDALQKQIAELTTTVKEIQSAIQKRQSDVNAAISNFFVASDGVRIAAKAQISGQSITRLDWVTHPINLRISGPRNSAGISLPAPPVSASATFWLRSSAHPQGQKLIAVPVRFATSGDELLTDIAFQQTIAQPLEAALIAAQCPVGRYQVVVELELNSGVDKYVGTCGNGVLVEITP